MRVVLALLLLVGSGFAGAGTCPDTAPPWLELELIASELAEHGPARRIEVHGSGCIEASYGPFDVRHGTYAFELTGEELAALARRLDDSNVRNIDAHQVEAEIERARDLRARLSSAEPELFTIACADTHRITIREHGGSKTIAFDGLLPMSGHYREVDSLRRLADFARALDDLGRDPRVPLVTEAAR